LRRSIFLRDPVAVALARAAHRREPVDHAMRQSDQIAALVGESQPCDCSGKVAAIAARASAEIEIVTMGAVYGTARGGRYPVTWTQFGNEKMAFDAESGFDKLDFQANYEMFAARLVRGKNIETDRHFINDAKEMHIFV
jgi:hypothetical protein